MIEHLQLQMLIFLMYSLTYVQDDLEEKFLKMIMVFGLEVIME